MVFPSEIELEAFVLGVSGIDRRGSHSDDSGRSDSADDEVLGGLLVPVHSEGETVLEEACVKSEVKLLRSLPLKLVVASGGWSVAVDIGRIGVESVIVDRIRTVLGYVVGIHVASQGGCGSVLTPGCAELEVWDV